MIPVVIFKFDLSGNDVDFTAESTLDNRSGFNHVLHRNFFISKTILRFWIVAQKYCKMTHRCLVEFGHYNKMKFDSNLVLQDENVIHVIRP